MVVLQDDARPHAGCELIFRQADALALEIGGRLDAVLAHIDRVVTERPRDECRHAHIGAIALGGLHREARHRQLADVEIHAAERAEKDFLRRQIHEHRIDAVDLDRAVHERTHAVVIADRDRQLKFRHACLSRWRVYAPVASRRHSRWRRRSRLIRLRRSAGATSMQPQLHPLVAVPSVEAQRAGGMHALPAALPRARSPVSVRRREKRWR